MKRFRFRLERLERLRQRDKREAAVELAGANAEAEACRRHRQALEWTHHEAHKLWHAESQGADVDSALLRRIAEQIESARRAIEPAREREARALERLDAKRDVYVERSRACRVLEKLRQRRWQRWRAEAEREEQQQLDELHLLQRSNGEGRQAKEARE